MGIKSTYYITREIAKQILLSKIINMTDSELVDSLEACNESYFRNYQIVSKEKIEENFNSEYPSLAIQYIDDF